MRHCIVGYIEESRQSSPTDAAEKIRRQNREPHEWQRRRVKPGNRGFDNEASFRLLLTD